MITIFAKNPTRKVFPDLVTYKAQTIYTSNIKRDLTILKRSQTSLSTRRHRSRRLHLQRRLKRRDYEPSISTTTRLRQRSTHRYQRQNSTECRCYNYLASCHLSAAERSRLKNARSIASQLLKISKQFWKVTCEAAAAPASFHDTAESPLQQILSFCNLLTAEILSLSLLGLHGVECLRMAVKLLCKTEQR